MPRKKLFSPLGLWGTQPNPADMEPQDLADDQETPRVTSLIAAFTDFW